MQCRVFQYFCSFKLLLLNFCFYWGSLIYKPYACNNMKYYINFLFFQLMTPHEHLGGTDRFSRLINHFFHSYQSLVNFSCLSWLSLFPGASFLSVSSCFSCFLYSFTSVSYLILKMYSYQLWWSFFTVCIITYVQGSWWGYGFILIYFCSCQSFSVQLYL